MCLKEPLLESSGEKQSPSCSVIVTAPPRLGLDRAGATAVPGGLHPVAGLPGGGGASLSRPQCPLRVLPTPPRNDQNYKLR